MPSGHVHPPLPKVSSVAYPPPATSSSASVFSQMPLEDVLEDLASRFILNLPAVELTQIERICFQVEQAHWFYEDFVRPNGLLNLPSYNLKTFTNLFFEKCDFLTAQGAPLSGWDPETAYDKFLRYKERVPVCGAIMFNEDRSKVLLVRGFKANSSWSFPRGKINENELPRDCAVREVLEETGFDITPFMSLQTYHSSKSTTECNTPAIPKVRPSNPTPSGRHQSQPHQHPKSNKHCTLHREMGDHFIEITIREQRLRMYLVTGIPDDTVFETQTRQEIGQIAWFPLTDLPTFDQSDSGIRKRSTKHMDTQSTKDGDRHRLATKFYMVVPFINDMRTWLSECNFLTPPGKSLLTPKAQDHQRAYVPTPPLLANQPSQFSSQRHPGLNSFEVDKEAAAVHERASRLQTFRFDSDDLIPPTAPLPSFSQDPHPSATRRKNKKRISPKKRTLEPKIASTDQGVRPVENLIYLSDQLPSSSTEEEEESEHMDGHLVSPWNDIEEGTRALQKYFFGAGSHAAVENQKPFDENSGSSSPLPGNLHPDQTCILRSSIGMTYQPFQVANPTSLHRQVERELNQSVEIDHEKMEPPSEVDTDVVKGYDLSTSYASSLSSSYRGPSTQIPSSDEHRPSALSPAFNHAPTNLFNQLFNMGDVSHPNHPARAPYSEHAHLAAPRPQPAPHQVERLLAMLQAPTPGPLPGQQPSLLTQKLSGTAHHSRKWAEVVQEKSDTPTHHNSQKFGSLPVNITAYSTGRRISSPILTQVTPPKPMPLLVSNGYQSESTPSLLTQLFKASGAQVARPEQSYIISQPEKVPSPHEPPTPTPDLVDLLLRRNDTSPLTTNDPTRKQIHSFHHPPSPSSLKCGGLVAPYESFTQVEHLDTFIDSIRLPLRDDERREKKEALLRQLHHLASI